MGRTKEPLKQNTTLGNCNSKNDYLSFDGHSNLFYCFISPLNCCTNREQMRNPITVQGEQNSVVRLSKSATKYSVVSPRKFTAPCCFAVCSISDSARFVLKINLKCQSPFKLGVD
jgi:hypothetical protein